MRRLLLPALIGGALWWLFGRKRGETRASVTVGYADGSAITLEEGSPELARLLAIAAEATAR